MLFSPPLRRIGFRWSSSGAVSSLLVCAAATVPASAQIAEFALVPTAEVGGEGEGGISLEPPPILAVAPDGRVAVPQIGSAEVMVFSPDGDLLARLGGRGDDPGRFQHVSILGWRGDTLWVADQILYRVTSFPPDDRPRTHGQPGGPLHRARLRVPIPLLGVDWLTARRLSPRTSGGEPIEELLRTDSSWETLRPLVTVGERRPRVVVVLEDGGGVMTDLQPFSEHPRFALSPDGNGVVVVRPEPDSASPSEGAYFVTRIDVHGDTLFHVRRRVERRPISAAARHAVIGHYASHPSLTDRLPTEEERRDLVRGALLLPEHHPSVPEVVTATDGRTWLRGVDDWEGPVRWEVLDERGNLERSVLVDRNVRMLAPDSGGGWGVILEGWGRARLVRYSMERRGSSNQD
jgi:hypothetical protein